MQNTDTRSLPISKLLLAALSTLVLFSAWATSSAQALTIDGCVIKLGMVCRNHDLWGADLHGRDLRFSDLTGTSLGDADLRGANLGDTNLSGADLNGADL